MPLADAVAALTGEVTALEAALKNFNGAAEAEGEAAADLAELRAQAQGVLDLQPRINTWCRWQAVRREAEANGLEDLVAGLESGLVGVGEAAAALHPGLPARVRLSGLPQRSTPLLSGEVQRISPDTMVDERSGVAYYDLRVAIDLGEIRAAGLAESLQPGMPAEVVLVAEKSTVLQTLLQPLSGALFRTLRQ